MFTNSNNTNFVMFLSSVGIGLGVSAQKMKSTKIIAQQKLIKLQYINGGWTNTESLISASWINEYAILWSWLYKNNTQILVCTKWFWHVFFPPIWTCSFSPVNVPGYLLNRFYQYLNFANACTNEHEEVQGTFGLQCTCSILYCFLYFRFKIKFYRK